VHVLTEQSLGAGDDGPRRRLIQEGVPGGGGLLDVEGWLASPHAALIDLKVMDDVGVVGSRLDKHLCPCCGCNDRDRHLWQYMQAAGLLDDLSETRILHIAPEARLVAREFANAARDSDIAKASVVSAIERLARADRRLAGTTEQWDDDQTMFNMKE